MSLPTARTVAASVLVRVLKDKAFASAVLDAEVSRAVQLEPRDRALATELVYGSLRVLPWLEGRILQYAPRGLGTLHPRTHAELLLSAYQLFFLERVPAFAAVNEAVEAIKLARGPKLASFANAVLRKLSTESAATKGGALLQEATWASLPDWIREALVRALGEEGAKAFSGAGLESPPLGLRVNDASQRDALLAQLAIDVPRATFEPGKVSPLAILARGGGKSEVWPGADEAWSVQEEGSQLVALALGAGPGDTVLDACAGRGNKSAILARAVSPGGALDVADLHASKLSRLRDQLTRAGLPLREAHAVDWSVGAGDIAATYDRILVDAPCSGTGTLRRRPELGLRREAGDLERLAALQASIVLRAATCLKPGGRLVYAVCSVLEEEAEGVVTAILAGAPMLALTSFDGNAARALAGDLPTLRLLPHVHGTDGYFLASFQSREPAA
jgi:16S rRNA (cytosine967-C5)-methyltransferase